MSWAQYYETFEFSEQTLLQVISSHTPFIAKILSFKPSSVLEVGCGTGSMSIFIQKFIKCNVTAIDNDQTLIERAIYYNSQLGSNVRFKTMDAFDLDLDQEFDLVFSQGFLEHFTDEEIRRLIKEQIKVSNLIINAVPSKFYFIRDYGDERLLSLEKWKKILRDFNVEGFYYGSRFYPLIRVLREFSVLKLAKLIFYRERPQICIVIRR